MRALSGARLLLASGDGEGACSRAYYAMFNAAHAALLALHPDQPVAKTHSGLIAAFGQRLIREGHFGAELGRTLNQVQQLRMLADYIDEPPALEDVAWAVEQAEAFVSDIKAKLSSG